MNTNTSKKNSSALESFKLFYEHTDDNRVIVNKQARPLKRPTRNTAARR